MNVVMRKFLTRMIASGNLEVIGSDGSGGKFGDGSGPYVRIRFTSAAAERQVILNPDPGLPEAYMDGGFALEQGTLYDLLHILMSNVPEVDGSWWMRTINHLRNFLSRLHQINTPDRSRRNVHSHYDLDGRLYSLFLDPDMQYSCAYFEDGSDDLADAQLAKKRHLAAKLNLKPGQRVLDIGSGWGGLGLYLAEHCDVDVTGVTLSDEQHAVSTRRASELGLSDRVRFLLKDYRSLEGPFDRIVSVGMFEHVGLNHYRAFFRKIHALLAEDGVALLHSISRFGPPADTSAFIRKYIFPGGYIPAMSEVLPHIERSGLMTTDIEILRLHYAKTLQAWRERFLARRDDVLDLYDERFIRMWEFYLAASELAFRFGGLMNFQIQMTRNLDALPLTRDYIGPAEGLFRQREARNQLPGSTSQAAE